VETGCFLPVFAERERGGINGGHLLKYLPGLTNQPADDFVFEANLFSLIISFPEVCSQMTQMDHR
jgi:hypothetical protein